MLSTGTFSTLPVYFTSTVPVLRTRTTCTGYYCSIIECCTWPVLSPGFLGFFFHALFICFPVSEDGGRDGKLGPARIWKSQAVCLNLLRHLLRSVGLVGVIHQSSSPVRTPVPGCPRCSYCLGSGVLYSCVRHLEWKRSGKRLKETSCAVASATAWLLLSYV